MFRIYTTLTFLIFLSGSALLAQPGNTINFRDSFVSGTFVCNYDGEVNGRNSYKSSQIQTQDVGFRWSGSRWEIYAVFEGTVLYVSNYDVSPNPPNFETGNWKATFNDVLFEVSGSGTQAVTLGFTLDAGPFAPDDGVQTGLGGGTPTGGVYSGPGVTNNGNGTTFSFDPAAAGVGTHTISYGDGPNGANNVTQTIVVECVINWANSNGAMAELLFDGEVNGRNSYSSDGPVPGSTETVIVSWSGTQWQITAEPSDLVLATSNYDVSPNPPDLATGNWQNVANILTQLDGCGTQAVQFDFPTMFDPLCTDVGVQTGLGGGTPAGGVYSGPGVTDDGNGMTFSFDPAAAGAGVQTITYGDGNNSATSSIEVSAAPTATFTSTLTDICENAGVQSDLGGGMPEGGVYSGPGVTDDGNGMTFSFDPAAAGVGTQTVTYTVTSSNIDQEQPSSTASTGTFGVVAPLAQSFIPTVTQICGAGIFVPSNSGSGNLTIALWDALPNAPGANMLASSMVAATADSYADVSWATVDVLLDNTYYLVFTGDDAIRIGFDSSNPYTNGQAYFSANFPYESSPNEDFAFRTFTCSTSTCTAEATADIAVSAAPTATFTSTLTEVCEDAGVQSDLGGGMPEGGVYSGPGVTDDGNGMTFSFDPAAAGVGTQTVTYTVTSSNIDQEQTSAPLAAGAGIGDIGPFAQSFIPTTTQICGGGFFVSSGSGDLTIALWDELPNVSGANMLASGMVAATADSYADVSWAAVDVMPGNTYYLVVTGEDAIFIGIDGSNPYANGLAYGSNNFPYQAVPSTDLAFRTFTCSTITCTAEATADIEVFATPTVTFTPSVTTFNLGTGVGGIMGGSPEGGVYSGPGVTDSGNGLSFSFNPDIPGVGTHTLTYTYTDGNGCTGAATADVVVEENCDSPVITGINILECDGDSITLQIEGMLNGGAQWEWLEYSSSLPCEEQTAIATGEIFKGNYLLGPDLNFFVRGVGGCASDTVCFEFVPSDLIATSLGLSFTPPGPFTTDDGLQPLTGGMPMGGTYSGTGVVDNGDGTYSFDPAVGAGTYTITYTYTDSDTNICTGSVTGDIVVEMAQANNDFCSDATDINLLFGQAENEPQTSELFNNVGYTAEGDPDFGNECFFDGDGFQNTLWLTFTGDGNLYNIRSVQCNATDYIDGADTQIAIYTGTCDNLTAVACGEDEDAAAQIYNINIDFQTEAGVTYLVAMDGYGGADGEFCLEVTNLGAPTSMVTFQVDASQLVANGTLSAEGIFLAGEFNGWPDPGDAMTEGADNIWSITLELPVGDTLEYKFQNGPGGWESIDESFGDPCTLGDFGNRFVEVGETDITQDLVCFNYCVTCDIVSVTNIQQTDIRIFPNPTSGELYLEGLNAERVDVFSNTGQLVRSVAQPGNRFDLSGLPAGMYMLRLEAKDGVYSARVVKE